MFSVAGKSCVVSGASRGLGRAIALTFADQGADVVLAARSVPDLEELRKEIEGKGRRAVVARTDVTDVAQLGALADTALSSFGKLDVWVKRFFGYDYQVWIFPGERRMFALLGVRGQAIFVDPASKLVMVHTRGAEAGGRSGSRRDGCPVARSRPRVRRLTERPPSAAA